MRLLRIENDWVVQWQEIGTNMTTVLCTTYNYATANQTFIRAFNGIQPVYFKYTHSRFAGNEKAILYTSNDTALGVLMKKLRG